MRDYKKLTKKELAWCKRLEKVLAAHPEGLWLFADGRLHVMKEDPTKQTDFMYQRSEPLYIYSNSTIIAGGGDP